METKTIKELKKGQLFKTSINETIWIRGKQSKYDNTYLCYKQKDWLQVHYFNPTEKVYINF